MSRQISADLAHAFENAAMPANQRTKEGRFVRDEFNRIVTTIPPGASGVAVLIIDSTGAEIGAALKTKRGWTLEPSLKVAIREGRALDVSFLTRVTW